MKLSIFFSLLTISFALSAAKGEIVYYKNNCDWMIVETQMGYSLLEWYGGYDPDEGDILVGDLEEYGMHDMYNLTSDTELNVWVEEFWMSWEEAIEEYYDEC